jgi:FAD/FMN-containing dehydrogenase
MGDVAREPAHPAMPFWKENRVTPNADTQTWIAKLRTDVTGRVVAPHDPDYDETRRMFLGDIDERPAVIVRVADALDVARVIAAARETGLELAVRSGGHSPAGHSTTTGGIVLDLRDLDAMEIDAAAHTAWAGSGLTAGAYTRTAGAQGLATGFGDTASVGIGGITLAGGIGFLVRAHGMTIDSLLGAELVTADGEVRTVDADHEPDLFWAIRGGGGNFGVATRFRFVLHPLPEVVGGLLFLPATPETVERFLEEAQSAPDEVSTIANVMPAPPMPFLPEERHGELVIMAFVVHAGGGEPGERAVAPFRTIAEPLADMIGPKPYPEIYMPEDPDYHPIAVSRTSLIDTVDRATIETILDRLDASRPRMRVAQIRALGGAMARVPNDATAFAHRDRPFMLTIASLCERPDERPDQETWVNAQMADLRKDQPGAAYVGFLADEGEDRIRETYPPPTWERLVAIKDHYDPTNLFRRNQNVPPGTA